MQLPPLNAVRAFEAAARHGSFVRAAAELHVSPGAVSRYVRQLEARLGVALFRRLPQGVRATAAAEQLLPKLTTALMLIEQATSAISTAPASLRVLASPTFANRWLVPRLQSFAQAKQASPLSVDIFRTSWREFREGEHDIGVATFYMPADWPVALRADRFWREELIPLCAPALLGDRPPLQEPRDLRHHTLLRIAACDQDWPNWLATNGALGDIGHERGPSFGNGDLAIRAAVEGIGVVLMDRLLVTDELSSGLLVEPFPRATPVDNGYYFFCARRRWDEPAIAAFRDWLIAESGRYQHSIRVKPSV
ncbi:MAG: LysR substrate-binding domain-containing protein [Bacteroidales bacterium]